MSIFYKNQGFKQSDTAKATVLTCPVDGTIIVKSVYVANNDASSGILVNMNLVDSSDSSAEYEFFRDEVGAKSQVNATPQGLNLEASDAITVLVLRHVVIVVQSILTILSVFILSVY